MSTKRSASAPEGWSRRHGKVMRFVAGLIALMVLGNPALVLGQTDVAPRAAPIIDSEPIASNPPAGWRDDPDRPIVVQPTDPLRRATTDRLNIIMLVIDDLADMDTRVWERLPNIRATFLDNGLRFTNYSGNDPLCCPGRANLLTGLWSQHHGVVVNDALLFRPEETIATELHGQGYYTAIVGKYFNGTGHLDSKTPPGWDHASIYSGGYYRYTMWVDGVPEYHDNDRNDYSTDVIANTSVRYLRAAPPDQPLFAYLSPYAVHAGEDRSDRRRKHMPAPPDRFKGDARCADIAPWRPANYNEADVSDKPALISGLPPLSYADGWPMAPICQTLLAVDEMLGRVREELAGQGRLDNTLFVMTADNGMAFGAHRWPTKRIPYATPMPLFMSWTKGLGAGTSINPVFIANVDIAPTLCGLAGCRLHDFPGGQKAPDGLDLSDQINRSPPPGPDRTMLFEGRPGLYRYELGDRPANTSGAPFGQDHPWWAIRTTDGVWHYVGYATGDRELYDLVADPAELSNLAADPSYARILAAFDRRARDIIAETPDLPLFVIPTRPGATTPPPPTASPSAVPAPSEVEPGSLLPTLVALVLAVLIGAVVFWRIGRGRTSKQ